MSSEQTAPKIVGFLKTVQKSLVTAESCTGGQIADQITQVSGSSDVYWGGWVLYSNEAKVALVGVPKGVLVAQGAVSGQTATAMAEGALKKARDGATLHPPAYALATTGIAGPTGGTAEKPVGLCFIALARTGKSTVVQKIKSPVEFDRIQNKNFFTAEALKLLLNSLEER